MYIQYIQYMELDIVLAFYGLKEIDQYLDFNLLKSLVVHQDYL